MTQQQTNTVPQVTVNYSNLSNIPHNIVVDEISTILANSTGDKNPTFFRIVVVYFLAIIASTMRTNIKTNIMGTIPVNVFAIALGTSGFGKGTSIKIMEKNFLQGFKYRYIRETFLTKAKESVYKLACDYAIQKQTDENTEYDALWKEFLKLGSYVLTFDSGTVPAAKQLRDKCLMAETGSINLQIDEIGCNLTREIELLGLFLELFDGETKKKLVKNTNDNKRTDDLDGVTPANILLFGTPNKLFDGSSNEKDFFSLLETGYARRCIFANGVKDRTQKTLNSKQIYDQLSNPQNMVITQKWRNHFMNLADPFKHGLNIDLLEPETIQLIEYKIYCEERADKISEFEETKKAEMAHRHFKALKIAGIYAFIEENQEISMDNLLAAIKLVEESGEAFNQILSKEPSYVKLAKFIASNKEPITHADLHQALPFYKETSTKRKELMSLAIAWGYKNFVIIKSEIIDGIEFFSGESLQETNLDQLLLSVSDHPAYNYESNLIPFEALETLGSNKDYSFSNHSFKDKHRCDLNTLTGFNLVVLDIDKEELSIKFIENLLQDIKYFLYTTKSHEENNPRYRLVIPIKYILHLDINDYRIFINNIIEWLPKEIGIDSGSNQRSKKWLMNDSSYKHLNTNGEIFDPLPFIPKTNKNIIMKEELGKLHSQSDLEKWFIIEISNKGQRNNHLIRYALILKDNGFDLQQIEQCVLKLNSCLKEPLSEGEVKSTIIRSIANKIITESEE